MYLPKLGRGGAPRQFNFVANFHESRISTDQEKERKRERIKEEKVGGEKLRK